MDSSRTLAVKLLAGVYGLADRAGRAVSMEREHIEDLFAEARAMYEAERARESRDPLEAQTPAPTVVSIRGRAA